MGSVAGGVNTFQSSDMGVVLLVRKDGNGNLFEIVQSSFSTHFKSIYSSEIIQGGCSLPRA